MGKDCCELDIIASSIADGIRHAAELGISIKTDRLPNGVFVAEGSYNGETIMSYFGMTETKALSHIASYINVIHLYEMVKERA